MACNSCSKGFSLLRKEKGCPGCGFSYCSSCLSNKIFVPKLNAEAKVCLKCKNKATKPQQSNTAVQPPDAYYRRLGVMSDKPDNTVMNKPDLEILTRLQKLKEDRSTTSTTTTDEDIRNRLQNIKGEVPSTSDAEIQERLAKLRGLPVITSTKTALPPPETRTEQEQADDLLKQYMDQTNIDTKYKDEFDELVSNMELRVQKLKETNSSKTTVESTDKSPSLESEDEEEVVKKIVEKIKAEAFMDNEIPPSTNDELPFCEICNEDARMRCLGCKYLFCKRCFIDHKDDDDGCNRYEPYEAPKSH